MNEQQTNGMSRRRFFELTFGWCAALLALGASGAAAARFMIPNVLYEADARFKALKPEDYPDGATFLPESRLFIIRKGNSFRAVSAICTHLGCTVNLGGDGLSFACPCHGSRFISQGQVTGGPAPRPLAWFLVSLTRDGRLLIDTTQNVAPDKYLVV